MIHTVTRPATQSDMKRHLWIVVTLLCVSLLSACTPRVVGQMRALKDASKMMLGIGRVEQARMMDNFLAEISAAERLQLEGRFPGIASPERTDRQLVGLRLHVYQISDELHLLRSKNVFVNEIAIEAKLTLDEVNAALKATKIPEGVSKAHAEKLIVDLVRDRRARLKDAADSRVWEYDSGKLIATGKRNGLKYKQVLSINWTLSAGTIVGGVACVLVEECPISVVITEAFESAQKMRASEF